MSYSLRATSPSSLSASTRMPCEPVTTSPPTETASQVNPARRSMSTTSSASPSSNPSASNTAILLSINQALPYDIALIPNPHYTLIPRPAQQLSL